jgi:FMN phosphatase YigB (HAD superfamily)
MHCWSSESDIRIFRRVEGRETACVSLEKRVWGLLSIRRTRGSIGKQLARPPHSFITCSCSIHEFDPFAKALTPMASLLHDVVFLVDVDNTLLDNDRIIADLRDHLIQEFGVACSGRYWTLFEKLRDELGYADYLGALQLYRKEVEGKGIQAQALLQMSSFLVDYPFQDRVYPGAVDALARMSKLGPAVILSDGDVVFQPRKIQRSGLWRAVEGRVLIYVHKELMQDEVKRTFPARHYVMVDDKPRILGALKAAWGDDVTTIFPRQGHYALDTVEAAKYPAPDIVVDHIGDLARTNIAGWFPPGAPHDNQHAATP